MLAQRVLKLSVREAWNHLSQGMPVLLIKDGIKTREDMAQATDCDELLRIARGFMRRSARTQPEVVADPVLSQRTRLRDCRDLFFWWLEFDKQLGNSRDPAADSRLTVCRDVFADAWEKAALLGYKLGR